jgi:hypothetical protein
METSWVGPEDENSTFSGAFLPVLTPSAHLSQVPFVHVRVERLQNPYADYADHTRFY